MLYLDKNPEAQVCTLEILANFKDMRNVRKRLKPSCFKVLNALYIITITNEKKGRSFHFPGKAYIAKVAHVGISSVTEFITSHEFEIFCDIKREKFISNHYQLRDWVYQWFRLFYRSGMMKNLHTKYEWWRADFTKRIRNWLIPLVQKGLSIRDIYERFVNKLSTTNPLKPAATNPLKPATMKPSGSHEAFRMKTISENAALALKESTELACILSTRLQLRAGDIRQFIFNEPLRIVGKGVRELCYRLENRGWKPTSNVRALQSIINEIKTNEKMKWTR